MYKWVDESGDAHYTVDRSEIPQHLRRRLRPVAPPAPEPPPERAPFGAEISAAPTLAAAEEFAATEPAPEKRDPAEIAAEIRQLEQQIEKDHEELKRRISEGEGDGTDLSSDPELREIAERLPRLQAQLDELRREAEH